MIILHREKPFPLCSVCGKQLTYWVPGLPDNKHAHINCKAVFAANESIDKILNKKPKVVD